MQILLFIVIFSFLVISHEFGHFIVAKANGIRVVEFDVGMGPAILTFGKGETKYCIRLLPFGGACVFDNADVLKDGEEGREGETVIESSYLKANVWRRISVVLAGPLFNLLLAFVMAFIMVGLIVIREPIVDQITPGGGAQLAGLMEGDRITKVNGNDVHLFDELRIYTYSNPGADVEIEYERDGKLYETVLTPTYDEAEDRYYLGVVNTQFRTVEGLEKFRFAWYEVRYGLVSTYKSLGMLVSGKLKRTDVAGPVGVAVNVVGKMYEETKEDPLTLFVNMVNIVMLLSVNLGIMNLLPLPAIDGGKLVFLLIEVVRGKPVPPEKEGVVHFIGMMLLLALTVFIFYNDLVNIFG